MSPNSRNTKLANGEVKWDLSNKRIKFHASISIVCLVPQKILDIKNVAYIMCNHLVASYAT